MLQTVIDPRTKRSPTTEPIEPEMNRNSNAAATIGIALQSTGHDDQRVALVGFTLGLHDALAITLRILESQGILRLEIGGELVARLGIEEHLEPLARADPQVMTAFRADVQDCDCSSAR